MNLWSDESLLDRSVTKVIKATFDATIMAKLISMVASQCQAFYILSVNKSYA